MEEHCSTGQSPQWAVVPMEEEEEGFSKSKITQSSSKHTHTKRLSLCFYQRSDTFIRSAFSKRKTTQNSVCGHNRRNGGTQRLVFGEGHRAIRL